MKYSTAVKSTTGIESLHETDDDWNSFFEIVLIDKCETKELLKVNRYIVELLILCQLLLVTVPTRVQGMFSCWDL